MTRDAADPSVPLIELDRATVCRGTTPVLHDLSLAIGQRSHTAILGPNGCGKSTLVKLIHRDLYAVARAGGPSVRVLGQSRWDVFALRERLGIVAPDLERDLLAAPGLSAADAVVAGFFASRRLPPHRQITRAMREHADEALAEAGAAQLASRPLASLSTGEARRVLIARALVHRPEALLLDEPTTGLDLVAQRRFLETLSALASAGTTLVLVTHHIEEVLPEIERVVLLKEGRVFADGAPDDVLTSESLSRLYDAPLEVESADGRFRVATRGISGITRRARRA